MNRSRPSIDVGATVGPYEIVSEIKRGGMATLFVARRSGAAGFTRHVAIKVVHTHLAQDDEFVRMFIDEAKLAAQIKHPNVVHVEELGEADGAYYLVMEYIHGCSLSELLRALAEKHRRLRPEIATWIAAQVAQGLHAAHELCDRDGRPLNVVHRDVSPHNVLLSIDGHVKLIDFGVAKAERRAVQTKPGALRGKLRYMAPEQLSGRVDRTTDLYALGIVLWEMLCGRRRFIGDEIALIEEIRNPVHPPPSKLVDVPKSLDDVVLSVLSSDGSQRPQTGRELSQRLIEAMPEVARVDAKNVSEVIRHFASSVIEERRLQLPESLTGVDIPQQPTTSGAHRIVEQLTISQAGQNLMESLQIPVGDASYGGSGRNTKTLMIGIGSGLAVGIGAALAFMLMSSDPVEQPTIAGPPVATEPAPTQAEAEADTDAGATTAATNTAAPEMVFEASDSEPIDDDMTEEPTESRRSRMGRGSRMRRRQRGAMSEMTMVEAPMEMQPAPREVEDELPGFTTMFD